MIFGLVPQCLNNSTREAGIENKWRDNIKARAEKLKKRCVIFLFFYKMCVIFLNKDCVCYFLGKKCQICVRYVFFYL